MPDDVRPPQIPLARPTNLDKNKSDQPVDEQKLEAEFGPPVNPDSDPPQPTKMQRVKQFIPKVIKPRQKRSHTMTVLLIAIVVLLVAAAASFVVLQRQPGALSGIFVIKQKPYVPTTVASTLTGLQVAPAVNDRPVTAVMIENSLDARPQSGLDQAGVVFEALAEGGVTRFMALYQDTQPNYLGPIRSARPYYIEWLLGFDAAYAHVGGSPDALKDITTWHVKDMNQFYNGDYYQRINSRYAPHNVYTSIARLHQLEASKGYGKSNYTGFARKGKEAPLAKPTAKTISIHLSGSYYDSSYVYSATTNTYKRSESGTRHMEQSKTGKLVQIAPKVVIAMIVPEQAGKLDSSGAYYADYAVIGSGKVVIFQDGGVITGTWSKDSRTSQISFKDKNGQTIPFTPGQTWVVAVPNSASNVTYK